MAFYCREFTRKSTKQVVWGLLLPFTLVLFHYASIHLFQDFWSPHFICSNKPYSLGLKLKKKNSTPRGWPHHWIQRRYPETVPPNFNLHCHEPNIPLLSIYPKELKTYIHTKTYIHAGKCFISFIYNIQKDGENVYQLKNR